MMRKRLLLSWIVGLMLLTVLSAHSFIVGQDKSPLKLIQKVPMPNVKGRLDHFGVDLEGRRLFVAALGDDQNTVEVIDLKMGKRVFSIPGQSKPQGVFYSPDFKKLFVANGTDGTCKIFAGETFRLIDNLPIGTDADHVGYDPATKYLYVGFGDAKSGGASRHRYAQQQTHYGYQDRCPRRWYQDRKIEASHLRYAFRRYQAWRG